MSGCNTFGQNDLLKGLGFCHNKGSVFPVLRVFQYFVTYKSILMENREVYCRMAIGLLEAVTPLPEGLEAVLMSKLVVQTFASKEFVLKSGEPADRMSFIAKGLVRIFSDVRSKIGEAEKEVSSWFLMEGDLAICVESYFESLPSREFIQALEPVVTVSIPARELEYLYKRYPAFNYHGRKLTERYYVQAIRQLRAIRYKKAEESYAYLQEQFPQLLQRVPSRYLASYLGVNETYLSTLRGRMRIKG